MLYTAVLADEIERAALDLGKDTANILTDDAQHHELDTAEERQADHDCGPAGDSVIQPIGYKNMGQQQQTDAGTQAAAIEGKPERDD